jgi:Fic family protein
MTHMNDKKWNWQQDDWPKFNFDNNLFHDMEFQFIKNSGFFLGMHQYIDADDQLLFTINIMSDEAFESSEIEGELLNRNSLQSSIRRNFGLSTDNKNIKAQEIGIANLMYDLYKDFASPLTHNQLFNWHSMIMGGKDNLQNIGSYRQHAEPMQIISGKLYDPKVHFEAPPSDQVKAEMDRFIEWFNSTKLPALTKASIAHLYFESIHPFEDGNGRIGRAIVEKSLSKSISFPILIALSQAINSNKKTYYNQLEKHSKSNNINEWISYFSKTILDAQINSINLTNFIINKMKFYDKFNNKLNDRQLKVVKRIFDEGIKGFNGGFSASNYIRITNTSRATATRDLNDLVSKNAFIQTGSGKGTRYSLINSENIFANKDLHSIKYESVNHKSFEEKIEEVKEAISIKLPQDPKKEIADITNEIKMLIDAEVQVNIKETHIYLSKSSLESMELSIKNLENSILRAREEIITSLQQCLDKEQIELCDKLIAKENYEDLNITLSGYLNKKQVKGLKIFGMMSENTKGRMATLTGARKHTGNILEKKDEIKRYTQSVVRHKEDISKTKLNLERNAKQSELRKEKINKLMNRLKTLQPTSKMDEKIQDHFGFENNSGGFRMG